LKTTKEVIRLFKYGKNAYVFLRQFYLKRAHNPSISNSAKLKSLHFRTCSDEFENKGDFTLSRTFHPTEIIEE